MKRVKSKLAIAVIAVAAIVLITGLGAYAYWSVSQQVTGNTLASGHMSISVTDGAGGAVQALNFAGIMPGNNNAGTPISYKVTSATGNPNVDLAFAVQNVAGDGTLKDNVKVAFLLCTDSLKSYWLTPTGATENVGNGIPSAQNYLDNAYTLSEFEGISWSGLAGYMNLPAETFRHINVVYSLPLDCAADCHDSTATFDMSFELMQSH